MLFPCHPVDSSTVAADRENPFPIKNRSIRFDESSFIDFLPRREYFPVQDTLSTNLFKGWGDVDLDRAVKKSVRSELLSKGEQSNFQDKFMDTAYTLDLNDRNFDISYIINKYTIALSGDLRNRK